MQLAVQEKGSEDGDGEASDLQTAATGGPGRLLGARLNGEAGGLRGAVDTRGA